MRMIAVVCLTVALPLTGTEPTKYQLRKTLHPSNANFREAPAELLFSPGGKLYVAYRIPGMGKTSSALRIARFDPLTGLQDNAHDYAVPSALLPRVATAFLRSGDSSTLAYAELHAPQVVVTIDAATLKTLSTSTVSLFDGQDFAPHVSSVSGESLVLSAGKLTHDGKVTAVHELREITLSSRNLGHVLSEKTVPLGQDVRESAYWRKRSHAQREVGQVLPLNDGALGLTNLMSEGWIQRFDPTGKEVAALHNPECGFVRVSLSPDEEVGAAVCERTGLDESHFGQTLRRDAVVFETQTLRVLAMIPMSLASVKERGVARGDLWVAVPSPAIWHEKGQALIAIADSHDSINLYSVTRPTPTTEGLH